MHTVTVDMDTITCGNCHKPFCVPAYMKKRWQQTGETWTCPLCGAHRCFNKPENDKLRAIIADRDRQFEIIRERMSWRDKQIGALQRSNAALRGVITKMRAKMKGGA